MPDAVARLLEEVYACDHCSAADYGFMRSAGDRGYFKFPPTIGAKGDASLLFMGINPRRTESNLRLHRETMASLAAFNLLAGNQTSNRGRVAGRYIRPGGNEGHYALHVKVVESVFGAGARFEDHAAVTELFFCATANSDPIQRAVRQGKFPCADRYFARVLAETKPLAVVAVGAPPAAYLRLHRVAGDDLAYRIRVGDHEATVVELPHPAAWATAEQRKDAFEHAVGEIRRLRAAHATAGAVALNEAPALARPRRQPVWKALADQESDSTRPSPTPVPVTPAQAVRDSLVNVSNDPPKVVRSRVEGNIGSPGKRPPDGSSDPEDRSRRDQPSPGVRTVRGPLRKPVRGGLRWPFAKPGLFTWLVCANIVVGSLYQWRAVWGFAALEGIDGIVIAAFAMLFIANPGRGGRRRRAQAIKRAELKMQRERLAKQGDSDLYRAWVARPHRVTECEEQHDTCVAFPLAVGDRVTVQILCYVPKPNERWPEFTVHIDEQRSLPADADTVEAAALKAAMDQRAAKDEADAHEHWLRALDRKQQRVVEAEQADRNRADAESTAEALKHWEP